MQISNYETGDEPRVARLLREPAHTDEARKPQQIAVSSTEGNTVIAALCEDGSIWTLNTTAEIPTWYRLPSIR